MSNVLIGILATGMLVLLALVGAFYMGDRFKGAKSSVETARIITEAEQVNHATNLYLNYNGSLPPNATVGTELVDVLVAGGYLKTAPKGANGQWVLDAQTAALMTVLGSDDAARKICVDMRRQAGMSSPETILACDGSGGELDNNDPCCVGS